VTDRPIERRRRGGRKEHDMTDQVPYVDEPTPGIDDWIVVPRWWRFQIQGLAEPPRWVRTYTSWLHDDAWQGLSLASKGLLHAILLAYAERDGVVTVRELNELTGGRAGYHQLDSLGQAGFVVFTGEQPPPLSEQELEEESPAT
jgi:hypothetical protein